MLKLISLYQATVLLAIVLTLIKYSNCNVIKHGEIILDDNNDDFKDISKYVDAPPNQNDELYYNLLSKKSSLIKKLLRKKILKLIENIDDSNYDDNNNNYDGYEDDVDENLLAKTNKRGIHIKVEMRPIRKPDGTIVWIADDKNKHYFIGK